MRTILLVDDEHGYIQPLSERLQNRGFDVTVAFDGFQALEFISTRSFDVVLLDVIMPGLSGLETFRRIRDLNPQLPVILLTGHAEVGTAIAEIRKGAFDYLVKPVPLDQLIEKIQMACDPPA